MANKNILIMAHLGILLTLLFVNSSSSFAIQPPPAKLSAQNISPSCLVVKPSYLVGQPDGIGTGSKGPAVQIKNTCDAGMIINAIKTATASDAEFEEIAQVDALLVFSKNDFATYKEIIFAYADENCKRASVDIDRRNQEEKELTEKSRKISEAAKARGEEDPIAAWHKIMGHKDRPRTASGSRTVACGSISVPHEAVLTIAIPWGTFYSFSGYIDKPKSDKADILQVTIQGKMINPRE